MNNEPNRSPSYGSAEWAAARERHHRRMNIIHGLQLLALALLIGARIYSAFFR